MFQRGTRAGAERRGLIDVPVIASHSSLRHFVPGFERNVRDEMLQRLAAGNILRVWQRVLDYAEAARPRG